MPQPEQQQLIAEAARQVIADVAPQELALVAPISAAYFADPEGTLRATASKDEPLGFGTPADVQLLTPIALAVTTQVVTFLVAEVRKSVQSEAPGLIHDLVKGLFTKLRPTPSAVTEVVAQPSPLSQGQLVEVRKIAVEKARQLGLTGTRAELLADSLVGGLAVAT